MDKIQEDKETLTQFFKFEKQVKVEIKQMIDGQLPDHTHYVIDNVKLFLKNKNEQYLIKKLLKEILAKSNGDKVSALQKKLNKRLANLSTKSQGQSESKRKIHVEDKKKSHKSQQIESDPKKSLVKLNQIEREKPKIDENNLRKLDLCIFSEYQKEKSFKPKQIQIIQKEQLGQLFDNFHVVKIDKKSQKQKIIKLDMHKLNTDNKNMLIEEKTIYKFGIKNQDKQDDLLQQDTTQEDKAKDQLKKPEKNIITKIKQATTNNQMEIEEVIQEKPEKQEEMQYETNKQQNLDEKLQQVLLYKAQKIEFEKDFNKMLIEKKNIIIIGETKGSQMETTDTQNFAINNAFEQIMFPFFYFQFIADNIDTKQEQNDEAYQIVKMAENKYTNDLKIFKDKTQFKEFFRHCQIVGIFAFNSSIGQGYLQYYNFLQRYKNTIENFGINIYPFYHQIDDSQNLNDKQQQIEEIKKVVNILDHCVDKLKELADQQSQNVIVKLRIQDDEQEFQKLQELYRQFDTQEDPIFDSIFDDLEQNNKEFLQHLNKQKNTNKKIYSHILRRKNEIEQLRNSKILNEKQKQELAIKIEKHQKQSESQSKTKQKQKETVESKKIDSLQTTVKINKSIKKNKGKKSNIEKPDILLKRESRKRINHLKK